MKQKNNYSTKLLIPQFEPSGKDIKIDELVNIDKYTNLVTKINILKNENKITEEEYKFLILGATRFIEFSYSNIAEYYCNASKEMQNIMEEELLILLDINNKLTESVINAKNFINEVKEKWLYENSEKLEEIKTLDSFF